MGKDYGAFLADLGNSLFNRGWLYSVSLPPGIGAAQAPPEAFANCDFVGVRAFGDAEKAATLDAAKADVAFWTGRGLPKSKLVLGIPLHGYGAGTAARPEPYAFSEILAKYPLLVEKDEAGSTIRYNGLATARAKARYVRAEGLGGVMLWSLDEDAPGEKSLLGAVVAALSP